MTHLTEVATLYDVNCSDIVAMLRTMADEIEAGEWPGLERMVTVVEAEGGPTVLGWGRCDYHQSLALLTLGLMRLNPFNESDQ